MAVNRKPTPMTFRRARLRTLDRLTASALAIAPSMESDSDRAMTTTRICNYFDHTATAVDPFWIDHLFLPLGTTV
jgi:hypothetical protein